MTETNWPFVYGVLWGLFFGVILTFYVTMLMASSKRNKKYKWEKRRRETLAQLERVDRKTADYALMLSTAWCEGFITFEDWADLRKDVKR